MQTLPNGGLSPPVFAFNEVQAAAAAGFVRIAHFQRARHLGQFPKPSKELPGVGPLWTRQQIETWLSAGAVGREVPTADIARQGGKDARGTSAPAVRPKMMRVRDVADRWALDVDTIYAMIRRGELEAQRFGAKCIRVPRSAVEEREKCQEKTEDPADLDAGASSGRLPENASMALRIAAAVRTLKSPR